MVGKCSVASLSIRYEFLAEFKPEIFVKIEQPEAIIVDSDFDSKKQSEKFATRLTDSLDKLKMGVTNQELSEFKSIF